MSTDTDAGAAGRGTVRERVDRTIESSDAVLFMKGDPGSPRCHFSDRAHGLVSQYADDIEYVNVLDALEAYREALEPHSGRQTIPQLFVDGEFVGGSDILAELDDRGELEARLAG
jgi:monothiol glutaredoxin